jgi:hypothetical protein
MGAQVGVDRTRIVLRKRWVLAGASVVVVVLAIPVVAFGIIPLFVRSTVYEPPMPPAPASSAEAVSVATDLAGELRRINPVHYGSGRVTLAGSVLRFENVDIAGAPNMYVYLSDRVDGQPGNFIDLGPLKATNGSFNYSVPAGVPRESTRSAVVWCRAFSVTVTFAVLA